MRKTVAKLGYLLLTELIAVYLVAYPVYAFQVSSSSTGYVRVATSAAIGVYQTAQRAAFTGALASAVSAPTAASIAVRVVTGPVGWTLLGVSVALTLAGMYYSSQDVQAVKTAALAAQPPIASVPNYTMPGNASFYNGCTTLTVGCVQLISLPNGIPSGPGCGGWPATSYPISTGTPPPGWTAEQMSWTTQCNNHYKFFYNGANGQYKGIVGAPTSATQAQYQSYIASLPASNANSIESKTSPIGQGVTAPAADNVTTIPVSPTDVATTVKPASQVLPTDAVIDPNATIPAGPVPTQTATQTTTGTSSTTTTTVTNPDGSVTQTQTQTETETAPVSSCNAGNHEQRSFGSILQQHIDQWKGTGLLSALNLLGTLVWPTASPTYTLQSTLLGNFTFDFTAWSGMLLAIRSVIIAIAGFVAYKIIFVGGRA